MSNVNNQHVFALLQGGEMIIFEFEDNKKCKENVYIKNYAEENLPQMVNDQFKQHFRMNRDSIPSFWLIILSSIKYTS